MICGYCSTELPSSARFCGECGRSLVQTLGERASTRISDPAEPAIEAAVIESGQKDTAIMELTVEPEPEPEPEPKRKAKAKAEPEPVPELDLELDLGLVLDPEPISVQSAPLAETPDPWVPPRNLQVPQASGSQSGEEDLDETRIVPPTFTGHRFVLQFSTGESVTVFGTGLIGRHPVAEPTEYFDHFVTIVDPGKSVSKTHLEFGQIANSFWISDRFSGNGTVVREPDSVPRRCEPGKRYRIVRGTRVIMGDQFFVIS